MIIRIDREAAERIERALGIWIPSPGGYPERDYKELDEDLLGKILMEMAERIASLTVKELGHA